ncbi:tape measure protein [Brenneria populi subsp. brevivirga]|uniref:tape measure protein n=1 Tax=Brenneria populi TaxID=1505588 RepID=UPI002E180AB4|nr:tape measure protein [Brenneria populi subsp. brevivirga]
MASSGSNLELTLRIQADLKNAQDGLRQIERGLKAGGNAAVGLGRNAQTAAAGLDTVQRSSNAATASLSKTRAGVESISTQLQRLQSLAGTVTGISLGAGALTSLANTSDEYSNLAARIRLVSTSNQQAAITFQSVSRLADDTGQRIGATAELYTRMARSLKGTTISDLLQVTKVVNQAATVSGATSQESAAAIIQLSQGLSSGTLRGEEFNSVAEQMPRVMEMLQSSLGKTRGELRKMAEDGLLTTEVVFRALMAGSEEIQREYDQMPATIARAANEMANAWMMYVGGANDATGATRAVAAVISVLAGNLDTLTTAAIAVAVAMGARKVAALASAVSAMRATRTETLLLAQAEYAESKAALAAAQAQMVRTRSGGITVLSARIAAENTLTAALTRQAAAEKALTVARGGGVGAGLMAMMGGPIGLAITGVTLALGGLWAAYNNVQENERQLVLQHQQTIQSLDDQTQKTRALITAQQELSASAPLADVLSQQKTNANVLEENAGKLTELQNKAAELKAAMASPLNNLYGGYGAAIAAQQLEKVETQLAELTPKFEALNDAQSTLSDGLEQRLSRALDVPMANGQALKTLLSDIAEGPQDFRPVIAKIAEAETALTEMSAEADKLKPKLEKDLADATYTAAEQLAQFRDNAIAAALAAGQAPTDIDKLRESMEKLITLQNQVDEAKESKRRSEAAARAAQSLAKSNETYVAGLEKQAAMLGKNQSQVRAYELAEKGLSGALKARAEAALAVMAANEQKTHSDANSNKNLQLQIQYLKSLGNVEAGGLLEVRSQMAELRKEFEKAGNSEGISWLDKLLPLQEAKVRSDALKQQFNELAAWRSQQETSIQAQVQGGLLSEIEGRRQLVALHQLVGDKITAALPALREMAQLPGEAGVQIQALLASLEVELVKLQETSNELTVAFRDGLQNGIESSLNGLADGTKNLSDAVINLGLSVVNAMSQIASQRLAQMAMSGISSLGGSLFGAGAGAGAGAAASGVADTAGSAATNTANSAAAASATTLSGALAATAASSTGLSTALATSGTAISSVITTSLTVAFSAAATAATSLATALASAAASSAGSSTASGIAGAMGSAASVAAATGGHITGPGTATSDSITARLSDGEFVVRAAAVNRYGVDFLHALNAGRLGLYADGGLVSHPPIRVPNQSNLNSLPAESASGGNGSAAPVIQQTLVLDAADVFTKGAQSVAGQRAMMTFIRANKSTLKQELG